MRGWRFCSCTSEGIGRRRPRGGGGFFSAFSGLASCICMFDANRISPFPSFVGGAGVCKLPMGLHGLQMHKRWGVQRRTPLEAVNVPGNLNGLNELCLHALSSS